MIRHRGIQRLGVRAPLETVQFGASALDRPAFRRVEARTTHGVFDSHDGRTGVTDLPPPDDCA